MPPHCDSLDGPVVTAAREALASEDAELALAYVPADGEDEVRAAYDLATKARVQGPEAREVADRYFFETVVRVHRAGEGAAFTGLKPAGLDVGPVIPIAERAIEHGSPHELTEFLVGTLHDEIGARFGAITSEQRTRRESLAAARRYVDAVLGLQVWAHKLYKQMVGR